MSEGLYPHTTRAVGTVLTAAIYNADHQNHITNQNPSMTGAYSDNLAEHQANTDPGGLGAEILAANLAEELEQLRFCLKRITGKAQWYIAPATNLEAAFGTVTDLIASESVAFTGDLSPAQITAAQNNYAPTGHADAFRFRLTSDANWDITGLAGGVDGRLIVIENIGSFELELDSEDLASTAANRFSFNSDVTLLPGNSVALQYDAVISRWKIFQSALFNDVIIPEDLTVRGNINLPAGFVDFSEISTPADPAANVGRLYAKDDGAGATVFAYRDTAGVESVVPGVATQAQMETGTSVTKASSPGRQHFHPGHPKAWVKWNGADDTIEDDYGVSSLTDGGTGLFTVNFTTVFSSANYAASGIVQRSGTNSDLMMAIRQGVAPTESALAVAIMTPNNAALENAAYAAVTVLGDQ